jgi:hypothetical protein
MMHAFTLDKYLGFPTPSWLAVLAVSFTVFSVDTDDMGFTTRIAAAAALALSSTTLATPVVSNHGTSLTLIYQNNLNTTDDANHIGAIVLDPMSPGAGEKACAAIGESLLTQASIESHSNDFLHSLSYLSFAGYQGHSQQYQIDGGAVTAGESARRLDFARVKSSHKKLPVLCTQSSSANTATTSNATASNQLTVSSGGNSYVGFRNQKSFRFSGIPYANPPARFEYSTLYSGTGETIQATQYGSDCVQIYRTTGGEQCLFLNIQTPYLPKAGSKKDLRPVLFSIHGGGFTGGDGGATSGQDSGNLASREDIVGVEINYRLSTLGFLAIPGTDIKGNFGISDQVVALEWVKKNIAQFGGDPTRVTIVSESLACRSQSLLILADWWKCWCRFRPRPARFSQSYPGETYCRRDPPEQSRWRSHSWSRWRLRHDIQLLLHRQRVVFSRRSANLPRTRLQPDDHRCTDILPQDSSCPDHTGLYHRRSLRRPRREHRQHATANRLGTQQ